LSKSLIYNKNGGAGGNRTRVRKTSKGSSTCLVNWLNLIWYLVN